jgi:hypothetical protein
MKLLTLLESEALVLVTLCHRIVTKSASASDFVFNNFRRRGAFSIGARISVVCSASFGLTVGGASVRLGESALLSVLMNVEFGSSLSAAAYRFLKKTGRLW